MKSAIFDCMVFLQAAVRDLSPAAQCLRLLERHSIELFVSAEILFEVGDVMNRPNIRSKFSVLTPQYIEAFLLKIQYAAKFIDEVPHLYSHRRDPNNEPYINLAIVTQANYLVSRDNDLLDLMRDSSFGAAYPDMTICTPEQFLTILKSL